MTCALTDTLLFNNLDITDQQKCFIGRANNICFSELTENGTSKILT